jgi:hypothetical protein
MHAPPTHAHTLSLSVQGSHHDTNRACSTALMNVEMATTDVLLRNVYRRVGKEKVQFRYVIINVGVLAQVFALIYVVAWRGSTLMQ